MAAFLEGRRCSLSALVDQLTAIQQQQAPAVTIPQTTAGQVTETAEAGAARHTGTGEGGAAGGGACPVSSEERNVSSVQAMEAASRLRTQLVDLATRKSYATKDAGVCVCVCTQLVDLATRKSYATKDAGVCVCVCVCVHAAGGLGYTQVVRHERRRCVCVCVCVCVLACVCVCM